MVKLDEWRIPMRRMLIAVMAVCLAVTISLPTMSLGEDGKTHGTNGSGKGQIVSNEKTIRAVVIGGMTMTGLWPEIVERFEKKTGYKVVLVDTGPRPGLDKVFREGKGDLLTMHSGDITTDLVVDGYGVNMRPWTRNDLVIYGPPSDPAHVKGLKSGAEAFKRIAAAKAPFLDALDAGGREMAHKMWKKAGFKPSGSWIIRDDSKSGEEIAAFANEKGAYLVMGRMPYLFEKGSFGSLEIMVEADPDMRRPYIVMEANPGRFPEANYKGARALSDFLLSTEIQTFLKNFRAKEFGGIPLFYPVWPVGK
jgi:tungstate transport system substrate-binding protein